MPRTVSRKLIVTLDPHRIVLEGVEAILNRCREWSVVRTFTRPHQLREFLRTRHVDLLITEIRLPGSDDLGLVQELRREYPEMRILVLSSLPENLFAPQTLRIGASGYLMKSVSSNELLRAVRAVLAGEIYLTPRCNRLLASQAARHIHAGKQKEARDFGTLSRREAQVLNLIGENLTNAQIACHLGISPKTVNTHKERIKEKLLLRNVTELTQAAVRMVDAER